MSKVIGNEMNMAHFNDFYYAEAMLAGLTMAKSANPEMSFRRSVEKLENDLREMFEFLSHNIALRVWVYLYAASLGEARHASDNCEMAINEVNGGRRSSAYGQALNYFPNDANTQILTDVFSQEWSSGGFGGDAWLQIVEGMKLYGTIPDAAFIDHAVDLHHNSGSVFTKSTTVLNFQCFGSYDYEDMQSFLTYKFEHDILNTRIGQNWIVSRKIHALLTRYSNIVKHIHAVDYCTPKNEFLSPYEIEWGYETLTTTEGSGGSSLECDWCDNKIDEDDHQHFNSYCICDSCYNRKVATCEHCEGEALVENMANVDGENWCENCALDAATCQECGEMFPMDNIQHTKDGVYLCENCFDENVQKCDECDEYVCDMEKHILLYHSNLPMVTIEYAWSKDGFVYEVETKLPDEQIETLLLAGAFFAKVKQETEILFPLPIDSDGIFEYVPEIDHVVFHKTSFHLANSQKKHDMVEEVYDVPTSDFVISQKAFNSRKVYDMDVWSLTLKTSGYNMGFYSKKETALKVLYEIKDLIDWTKITNQKDWDDLSEQTKIDIATAKNHAAYLANMEAK